MIAKMRMSSKHGTESQSVVESPCIIPIKNSNRLYSIKHAVPSYLYDEIANVDWLSRPLARDDRLPNRYRLTDYVDLQWHIDRSVNDLLVLVNEVAGTSYSRAIPTWHLCLSGSQCPMHTDGQKPNVMIIYWHTPGQEFGTTFYNSDSYNDVLHEFPGIPNTGFFANYARLRRLGRSWQGMWHAAPNAVPADTYRLVTQYELHK